MSYSEDIHEALTSLQKGGVILYPTDTIWGIGCDATDEAAVRRVFQVKQRDDSKALILLVGSIETLQQYVPFDEYPSHIIATLYRYLQSGSNLPAKPTTIIYPKVVNLPSFLQAQDGSVAIRLSHEVFSHDLCAALRKPLVSTSANISGHPAPQCFAEIDRQIRDAVDYVCSYRQDDSKPAQASTILRLYRQDNGQFAFATIRR